LTNDGVAVDGSLLRTDKVIIAAGAPPVLPPIPDIERVPHLTSKTALDLERLPRSLLVIGGGYIGRELGQMFARAGVTVTIVEIVPILLAGEPGDAHGNSADRPWRRPRHGCRRKRGDGMPDHQCRALRRDECKAVKDQLDDERGDCHSGVEGNE
jgi:hypothetical protein